MVNLARDLVARAPHSRLVILDDSSRDDSEKVLPVISEFAGLEAAAGDEHEHHHAPAGGSFRTILFTDVVGHTEIMQRLGDVAGRAVLREHEELTRDVLRKHNGAEVKTMGDGFMASFSSVTAAVECAIALQRAFDAHDWSAALGGAAVPETGLKPLSIRVGLNAGEPIAEEGDYYGATVILASRIAAQAGGAEILASNVVRELCSGKGFLFADRGETVLRGFEDPARLYEVRWRD